MPISTKVSGAWKTANAFVRVGGIWKAAMGSINASGLWKSASAKVATPAISSVTYPGAPSNMTAQVQITCATAGATIYTSVGGGAWTAFSSYVAVPQGVPLRAYAAKAGYADSDIIGPYTF